MEAVRSRQLSKRSPVVSQFPFVKRAKKRRATNVLKRKQTPRNESTHLRVWLPLQEEILGIRAFLWWEDWDQGGVCL